MSPSILSEAGKAYMAEAIISYTSAQKKEALRQKIELEKLTHFFAYLQMMHYISSLFTFSPTDSSGKEIGKFI